MNDNKRHNGTRLLGLSLLVLPFVLAACGSGGSTASGGSGGTSTGPTPTSGVAAVISKVSAAYGSYGTLSTAVQAAGLPAWVTVGRDSASVALTITITGSTFNGAANGTMTITVPLGWKVAMTLHNTTGVAQSLVIAAQTKTPLPQAGFTPAITGATTVNASTGRATGSQQFSFVARPAGAYRMVSAVPGHAAAGLWDHFDVSTTARAPLVTKP